MKQPFGTVSGFDSSLVVQQQAGEREVKYTVDRFGIERLLHPDSVAPDLREQDHRARRLSRALAVLPGHVGTELVRRADRALDIADQLDARILRWQARQPARRRDGLVPIGSALRPRLATHVTEYDIADERDRQRHQVLDALREAGIATVQIPAGPSKHPSVAIRDHDVDAVVRALTGRLDRSWHLAPIDRPHERPRPMTRRRLRLRCGLDGGFRLFRLLAGGVDRPVAGVEAGVDVEVWRHPMPVADDRRNTGGAAVRPQAETDEELVAVRRQAWSNRLAADEWADAANPNGTDPVESPHPHLFDVIGPIDVVYTWVDGADPLWNEARIAALGSPQTVTPQHAATDAARFRSHDELRYSLRSLSMYAPWVRTIHIVTAGQVPYWLDTDHPQINLVDHREIFPEHCLPVFNSHAIESRLHHIPGLSERYLYLNDDVFFGRSVGPDLFFHGNGLAKFFPSSALIDHGPRAPHDDPVTSAAKNNRQLIADEFGRTTTTIFQHTPHPQLRSVLEAMERSHPEEFARVAASKFRHPDDLSITSALHHYYAYAIGKALPARLDYLYLDLAHPRAANRLRRIRSVREFDVFCLNDSPDVSGDDRRSDRLLRSFLPRYYPLASPFELDTPTPHPEGSPRRRARHRVPHAEPSPPPSPTHRSTRADPNDHLV